MKWIGQVVHGVKTNFSNDGEIYVIADDLYIENVTQDKDIIFKTNDGGTATEVMRIDGSTSRVGIGTSNPSYSLDVASTGSTTLRLTSAGTGAVAMRYENAAGFKSGIVVDNNGTYRVDATNIYLNPTNNVGIGTSSPGAKFHINVDSEDNQPALLIEKVSDNNETALVVKHISSSNIRGIADFQNTSGSVMKILADGKVGIGNTSPSEKLDVVGNIKTTGIAKFYNSTSHYGSINADSEGLTLDTVANRHMRFKKAGVEVMRINTSGNVGIGTSSPGRDLQIGDGSSDSVLAIVGPTTGLSQIGLGDTDDDNYGQIILNNSSNKLQIQNGGGGVISDRGITLDSSENVGIGTSSPSRLLDVDGIQGWSEGTNQEKAYINPTNNGVDFNLSGDNGNIRLDSRAGSNSYITTGNLGIGTTSPTQALHLPDNKKLALGTSADLQIYHNGTNSYIKGTVQANDLIIQNEHIAIKSHSNENMIHCDSDGPVQLYYNGNSKLATVTGGVNITGELSITGDGSNAVTLTESGDGDFTIDAPDDIRLDAGGGDVVLRAGGTEYGRLKHSSGDFIIQNNADDKDIIFQSDNGAGGNATYFYLDGSSANHDGSSTTALYTNWPDNSRISLGSSHDFSMKHTGSDTHQENLTGDLYFTNYADDKDIIFKSSAQLSILNSPV